MITIFTLDCYYGDIEFTDATTIQSLVDSLKIHVKFGLFELLESSYIRYNPLPSTLKITDLCNRWKMFKGTVQVHYIDVICMCQLI